MSSAFFARLSALSALGLGVYGGFHARSWTPPLLGALFTLAFTVALRAARRPLRARRVGSHANARAPALTGTHYHIQVLSPLRQGALVLACVVLSFCLHFSYLPAGVGCFIALMTAPTGALLPRAPPPPPSSVKRE